MTVSADGITASDADTPLETTAPLEPITVRDLVGRNIRRLRLDASVDRDDIARAARGHGLDWTGTWIASIERGQKPLSAEHFVALPFVLTDALGHRVGLADLLAGDEQVLLTKASDLSRTAALPPAYLREVITAAPYRRAFAGAMSPDLSAADSPTQRAAEKMREIGRVGLGNVDARALARAEAGAGELEEKFARRLGVAPIVIIAAAAAMWGHSLTEERDARLHPDPYAEPGTPGPRPTTVVRKLTAEITVRLAEAEDAVRATAQDVAVPAPRETDEYQPAG